MEHRMTSLEEATNRQAEEKVSLGLRKETAMLREEQNDESGEKIKETPWIAKR